MTRRERLAGTERAPAAVVPLHAPAVERWQDGDGTAIPSPPIADAVR